MLQPLSAWKLISTNWDPINTEEHVFCCITLTSVVPFFPVLLQLQLYSLFGFKNTTHRLVTLTTTESTRISTWGGLENLTMSPVDMLNNDAVKSNYRIFIFHENNVIQSGRHQMKLHKQRGKMCVKNNVNWFYFFNSYVKGSVALLSSEGSSLASCALRLNASLFLTSCFASCPAASSSVCWSIDGERGGIDTVSEYR